MPKVEDQLLSTGGIKITGAGEATGKVLTSDAAGVGTWQAATGGSGNNIETTPIGSIMPFGSAVAPSGYLNCDGSAVSRTTYAALFAVINTTFGAGDGATTFNLPDLRGRGAIGSGQGATLTNRALGAIGGEEAHTLTVPEMPSHTHGLNYYNIASLAGGTFKIATADVSGISGTGATGSNGSGTAHNTMQPFVVTNYIIKAVAQPAGQQFALAAGTVPYVRAHRNAAQTITANGSWQKVLLDSAPENTDAMFDAANNRVVVKTPGVYALSAGIYFNGQAAAFGANAIRYVGLFVNGVAIKEINESAQSIDTTRLAGAVSMVRKLNAGDYIELFGAVNGGPDCPIANGAQTGIELAWIGEGRGVVGEQSVSSARVYMTAATQAVNNSVDTPVTMGAARWDTDGMWSSTNPTRLTARTPGIYDVGAVARFAVNANGDRVVAIKVNGTVATYASVRAEAADYGRPTIHTQLQLNAGDYVEMVVFQSSGGALNLVGPIANEQGNEMWATIATPLPKAVIPYVKLRRSVNTPITPVNNWVVIPWDIEEADNDGMHDNVTQNTRITIRTPGVYLFNWDISLSEGAGSTNSRRIASIWKNGAEWAREEWLANGTGGVVLVKQMTMLAECAVGDYFEAMMIVSDPNVSVLGGAAPVPPQAMGAMQVVKIGLSGQGGTSGGTQWATSGSDIQPTNSGQVKVPNGIKFSDNTSQLTQAGLVKIADATVVSGNTLRFAAIPQNFTHLLVYFSMQSTRAGFSQTGCRLRINGDTGAHYDFNYMGYHWNNGTPAADGGYAGSQVWGYIGQIPSGTKASNASVSKGTIEIPYYSESATYKHAIATSNMSDDSVYTGTITVGNQFFVAAAVTQIEITDDVGSALGPNAKATLYGIV
jgi:microcystin-dependent protein